MGRRMHIGSCVTLLAWASMGLGEAVWFVDAAGGGDYWRIQAAIEAAGSGDEILVAPGTYREAIDFLGKAICLYSAAGAESTTIDGTGHSHVVQCVSGEGADTILDGFTITGGNAAESYEPGGGLWSHESSPTVTRCIFVGNEARYGGGISGDATVSDCTFRNNVAYTGGGTWRTGTITRCAFIANAASTGGAVSDAQTVSGCTFIDNEEGVWDVETVTGCTFAGAFGDTGLTNVATVVNCKFTGSGIVSRGDLHTLVTNCTFINTGGIFTAQEGGITLTNCIIWGNAAGGVFGPVVVTYSDVEGGWPGQGNLNSNPLFADADGRLSANSPCIDAGTNTPPGGLVSTDMAGNPRPVDGNGDGVATADMGVYEHPAVPPRPLNADQLLANLSGAVRSLNLPQKVEAPLVAKLNAARKLLQGHSRKNNVVAANTLKAFCKSVETQRGRGMSIAQADALIASAQQMIRLLAKS